MDIGGGSTEFIYLDESGMKEMVSLNIGVSRLYQMLGKPKDFSNQDRQFVVDYFENEAVGCFDFKANVLVGASGSFETFWEMINKCRFESNGKAQLLNWEEFNRALDWAIHSTYDERHSHPWIVDMRKGMLPIGALKIKWIMEKIGVKEVWLSPYSLKEGAFVS
jgi:exopolyphosphatase/guanosine-5'-triphosphate,3'-diphosphate pyrophosphatase